MGMYTYFRGEIELKSEVVDEFRFCVEVQDKSDDDLNVWEMLANKLNLNKLKEFSTLKRSGWIVFGHGSAFLAPGWEHSYELTGNRLSFCCSLKNYDLETRSFVDALPEIANSWKLEELYEENEDEDDGSVFFEFKD